MHSRVVPGCVITTKGLTGTLEVSKRHAGNSRADAIAGPGTGASGHTRLIRKDWSPVAANWRRTLSVCTHADADAKGFLLRWVVWIGGGVLLNGVTAAAIATAVGWFRSWRAT